MIISNKEVIGIKRAVGDANRCGCDRWAIVLNRFDWRVKIVYAIGQDDFPFSDGDVEIDSGRPIYGDKVTVEEITRKVERTINTIDKAIADYNRGVRHTFFVESHKLAVLEGLEEEEDECETLEEFLRNCLAVA